MSDAAITPLPQPDADGSGTVIAYSRHSRFNSDAILHGLAFGSSLIVVAMLATLLVVLFVGAFPSIRHNGIGFLFRTNWQPPVEYGDTPESYGALAVIYGTAVSSLIALVLALPPSFAAAVFLVRIAPRVVAVPVSFLIEFLAAIPSLAYGLWGMFVLVPLLQHHIEPVLNSLFASLPLLNQLSIPKGFLTGNDMLAGGIILAIMILPIITALSRDILKTVPRAQVEGSIALGATWWQSVKEMLKFSRSALFGAVMLGLARAAGETMAVTMVIGGNTQVRASPFAAAQTMASLLAGSFTESADMERASLVQVALILLIMSLMFNIVARYLVVGKNSRTSAAH